MALIFGETAGAREKKDLGGGVLWEGEGGGGGEGVGGGWGGAGGRGKDVCIPFSIYKKVKACREEERHGFP